jgi:hypothetical protein
MRDPKRLSISIALSLAAALGVLSAEGDDTSAPAQVSTNHPVFTAELRNESAPGLRSISRAYLRCGTNQFAFLVPPGFRLDASDGTKVVLTSPDYGTLITLQLREPLSATTAAETKEMCRQSLIEQYPNASISLEFSRAVDGLSGPAFDLSRRIAGGAVELVRAVFIPSPAGVLEFKLVCSPARFRKASYRFNSLLLSFRAGHDGKLEIVPLSSKL